jgi:streptogramin lyase
MRWFHMAWLAAAVLTVAAACAPAVRITGPAPLAPASWSAGGGTGTIQASLGGPGFAISAANQTVGDISYVVYQLYNVNTDAIAASQSTVAQTVSFTSVADGTYRLKAEAFATTGSITLGGQQMSANTATVAGQLTTYSTGSALTTTLQLLHGTGESVAHGVTVTNGAAYGGSAAGLGWNPGVIVANPTVGTGPEALALDGSGNVWVANDTGGSLTKLNGAGVTQGTFTATANPFAIAVDGLNQVWVADRTGNKVMAFDNAGTLLGTVAVAADPRGVATGPAGDVWVTSNGTTTLTRLTPGLSVAGTVTLPAAAWDVATDGLGNAWVSHRAAGTVSKISPAGAVLGTFNVGSQPEGLRVDPAGNVWVACKGSNQVFRLSPAGAVAGTHSINQPESLDFDPAGNVYVACNDGNLVMMSPQGQIFHTANVGVSLSHIRLDGAGNAWLAGFPNNVAIKVTL